MMEKIPSWAHQLKQPCKGASEIILEQCSTFLDGEGNITLLSDMQKQNVLNIINSFASEALRTLCIAFKDLNEISDDQIVRYIRPGQTSM
jgi:P-type Ca2+ transporter type 2C